MNIYKIIVEAQYINHTHIVAKDYAEAEKRFRSVYPYCTINSIELVSKDLVMVNM